jgi:hypothetical protein
MIDDNVGQIDNLPHGETRLTADEFVALNEETQR